MTKRHDLTIAQASVPPAAEGNGEDAAAYDACLKAALKGGLLAQNRRAALAAAPPVKKGHLTLVPDAPEAATRGEPE